MRVGGYYNGFPDDRCCEPAAKALLAMGVRDLKCSKCPFPFCIKMEARKLHWTARSYVAASMIKLGLTVASVAARLGITESYVRRSCKSTMQCYWCSIDKLQANIFCRSDLCTIAPQDGEVVVVFSHHRKATDKERERIYDVAECMFPKGVLVKSKEYSGEHDHWVIGNLLPGEADRMYRKMDELSKYAPSLRGAV